MSDPLGGFEVPSELAPSYPSTPASVEAQQAVSVVPKIQADPKFLAEVENLRHSELQTFGRWLMRASKIDWGRAMRGVATLLAGAAVAALFGLSQSSLSHATRVHDIFFACISGGLAIILGLCSLAPRFERVGTLKALQDEWRELMRRYPPPPTEDQ